ncbi:alpha/beta hydrolase [Sphingobacterium sp. SGR-19]|uniref:alpha/beta hydrolase n=1 Tax=Sphingobacterium sp. SGR-19 TaxID=2710886 RepID=UPI0013EC502C|nr:alpha/beta hydrolase [Sphingobacterium sp. SGR-19]NGM64364.1 alpha/beta hydrolase [Sphingobacterium sp. SGR-19]
MRFISVLVLLIVSMLGSGVSAHTADTLTNVVYKTSQAGKPLSLDIFLPDPNPVSKRTPVVIIVHGGAWVAGNRTLETLYYMRTLRKALTETGVAVVSIDYTLLDKEIHFPDPVIDCKDAIRWVRAQADKYNFDGNRIGLWGGSAGGHLAMLAAYSDDSKWLGDERLANFSAKVSCVVDNFGPTDLNALLRTDAGKLTVFFYKTFASKLLPLRQKVIYALTGYTLEENKDEVVEIAKEYSPLYYVNSTATPTLILHGTKDRIVPIKQSKELAKTLTKYGIQHELIKVKNGDHGFNNISEQEIDKIIAETVIFYTEHLH